MPKSSSGSQVGDDNESICCSKCKKVFQDVDELELHEKKCFLWGDDTLVSIQGADM